ncbi:MAG: hypothetical protein KDB07_07615, partial [Planctomycetes bacterium]|nr:hypothetical protein [Planctomycetota bacterium]
MPVRISEDAATMANFETSDHRRGIDDDEVAIVLAQHRPPSASSDFATRVMNEIELRATMLPARPEPSPRIAFADDVMARLGDAPREQGKSWLRYLSHVGVAAAAVLFVLALSPFFHEETTSPTEAPVAESSNLDANDTPALAPALTGLKAKVREVFTRNGAQVATIDVGLVEGVRV